jgi:hypothetical protein
MFRTVGCLRNHQQTTKLKKCPFVQVSLLAVYLLVTADGSDVKNYALWQGWGIPISMAYFIADGLW